VAVENRRPHHTVPLLPCTTLFRSRGAFHCLHPADCQPIEYMHWAIRVLAWVRSKDPLGLVYGTEAIQPVVWRTVYRGNETVGGRSEEHTSELQSRFDLVCRLRLVK